jgi:peptidoglycan biosynthesis protein MviN/MurJ (putative lipid II flippase)
MLPRRLREPSRSTRALAGTVIGSLPGFILPFALAWRFHGGRLADAYFLSLAIATFVAGILSNVLEVSMIPAVAANIASGGGAVGRLVRAIAMRSVAVAGACYLLTALIGLRIVDAHRSWPAAERGLCTALILVFGLFILASTLTSVVDGALYALGRFFLPTVSQCIRTLLPLLALFATSRDTSGVIFTASLLVAGEAVRGLLMWRVLARMIGGLAGDGPAPPRSRLLEASLPLGLSLVVSATSPLVDKFVATPLGAGSVTVLELAEKVFFVPVLALSSSVVLVAGSRWARLSLERPLQLAADFKRTLWVVLASSAAAAVALTALVALATSLAGPRLLGVDSERLRSLVVLFLAGLPGAIVIAQGARLMTAMQRTRLLPLFAVSAFSVNLAGDILGAHLFGVDGIALASTLFRYVNAVLYVWICRMLLRTLSLPAGRTAPFLLR